MERGVSNPGSERHTEHQLPVVNDMGSFSEKYFLETRRSKQHGEFKLHVVNDNRSTEMCSTFLVGLPVVNNTGSY